MLLYLTTLLKYIGRRTPPSIGFLLWRISRLFLDMSWFTVLLHSSYRQTLARSFSVIPRYHFVPYEPNPLRFVQFDNPSRPTLSSSSNVLFATVVKKAISSRVSVARITSEILFSDQRDLRKNTLECIIKLSHREIPYDLLTYIRTNTIF